MREKMVKGANANYWIQKIEGNIRRDRAVNRSLRRLEWRVVRVWESAVLADPDDVASRILTTAKERRTGHIRHI
jgi:DNA mismatch endonuclease (patch repair protein)